MRFSRAAALSSTVVGAVAYVAMAALFGQIWRAPFTVALILSFGMMSLWMSVNVRRVVESEVGRLALERFLPRRLVDGAHRDPANPLGPPRTAEVTVLVSDLRGFTAIAQDLEPAQVMAILNELQGDFARVIDEHGGTVDKFMGDGMLAVFGAIEPLADHAGAAVAATRGLRGTLVRLNATRAASSLPALSMGVGVHSGTVVAGCLGGGPRLEFTVVGDTVNVASRLEAMTKEHQVDVLVSEETAKRLRTASERESLEPLGAMSIRGRAGTMGVFALGTAQGLT
jgi:class 3 adenylate cyclase